MRKSFDKLIVERLIGIERRVRGENGFLVFLDTKVSWWCVHDCKIIIASY